MLRFQVTGPSVEFVFLGDYVDGGWQTADLIYKLRHIESDYPAVFLRGNHEQLLLDAQMVERSSSKFHVWYYQGGRETEFSYQFRSRDDWYEDTAWLDSLPYDYETE